ncbi:hypothetical protein SISNIDRAFT_479235 [Sistotremastrum niveocremeum HHB9708]|uniref:FCH-domain-containing protein n=1 Tax=Sistotremastrum niveocremeum HHB9708 TaxID=1314777 RepID=A0A164S8V0_9AGAM|nr:hypothetical protein SISNIDRAFT_479235 [Sistotremastrum niveocremeum HHB9708]
MDTPCYGKELPDQFDLISKVSEAQLGLISDVRDLIKERSSLERDYAAKLQALAKKASDKKSRRMAQLVLGEEPTKAWDEDTLRRSTLDSAYSQLIASMESSSLDHVTLADALISQVSEDLRALERHHEESQKKQNSFYQRLLSERDKIYAERAKYDDECLELQSLRNKQDRSQDDKQTEKFQKQADLQRVEMLNGKNNFIVTTAVANQIKSYFYDVELPEIEDQLQQIQSHLVTRLVQLLLRAQSLHHVHINALDGQIDFTKSALEKVDPVADHRLFIEYNVRPFTSPSDLEFEPCATYYDTPDIAVEPEPKIYLQNKLNHCHERLAEISPLVESKRNEVSRIKEVVAAYTKDPELGDLDEVFENYLNTRHQLSVLTASECALKAESEVLMNALEGDVGDRIPHAFKSSAFSIPTPCAYCKNSIWGLSKQGKTCKSCGISAHNKCELKVPAQCGFSHAPRSRAPSLRVPSVKSSNSRISQNSAPLSSSPRSSLMPASTSEESLVTAVLLFEFKATTPYELSVSEGAIVQILEEDDGSGWLKVSDGRKSGLIPTSYVEFQGEGTATEASSTHRSISSQGCGVYVRALYDYNSQGEDELALRVGQTLELSAGPDGGKNYADGWWEGINELGTKGIFPSNYSLHID